jgi:alkaline phosphatase
LLCELPVIQRIEAQTLRFGWITDIHHSQAAIKWNRYYFESLDKFAEAIDLFNRAGVDFVIETGDLKDQCETASPDETRLYLREAETAFSHFSGPRYHVFGNHDLDDMSKAEFQSMTSNFGIPQNQSYYWFDACGFRLVVLDACFMANGADYNANNFAWYDTAIPAPELVWLSRTLESSPFPVLIFVHQPLDGEGQRYVSNNMEVRTLLEQSKKVVAVFQGHIHEGGYSLIGGIHYITLQSVVDGPGAQNSSYALVDVSYSQLVVYGFRRAKSLQLSFQIPLP